MLCESQAKCSTPPRYILFVAIMAKRSEQLTLVRWVSCADLKKKGSCWYAVEISLRKFNLVDEILKTYLGRLSLTL